MERHYKHLNAEERGVIFAENHLENAQNLFSSTEPPLASRHHRARTETWDSAWWV